MGGRCLRLKSTAKLSNCTGTTFRPVSLSGRRASQVLRHVCVCVCVCVCVTAALAHCRCVITMSWNLSVH